jgi:hypothetical protein
LNLDPGNHADLACVTCELWSTETVPQRVSRRGELLVACHDGLDRATVRATIRPFGQLFNVVRTGAGTGGVLTGSTTR